MTSSESPLIYLLSASPRRRELLERAGLPFEVHPVDADESIPGNMEPAEVVEEIALRKLAKGLNRPIADKGIWFLAADTLVEGPGGLLGKPGNRHEAAAMLESLSGREHHVHSGFAVAATSASGSAEIRTGVHSTAVRFRNLDAADVESYLLTGEWKGAAGGYRIQEKGELLVEEIRGLWSTVVGLPLAPLYGILSELSYPGL